MAHNLNIRADGRASMFYSGEVPWHKLGTKVDQNLTSTEAIVAAGLDYEVAKRPLFTATDRNQLNEVPGHFATIRTDTAQPLGVVGARYTPIQNKDAFTFFDSLVGADEAIYHTAGAIGAGETIWILAQLPGYIKAHGEDIIEKFLLLTNSHDGSSLVRAKLTPVRVVCSNTLAAALAGMEEEVRIRHTPSGIDNLREAHKLLGLSNELYHQLETIFQRMALKQVSGKQLVDYVKRLVPDNPEAEIKTRSENIRSTILELHENGTGAKEAHGTLWGALNATTEYIDHVKNSRNPEKQLRSMWFGSGEKFKQRAFELALEFLNN